MFGAKQVRLGMQGGVMLLFCAALSLSAMAGVELSQPVGVVRSPLAPGYNALSMPFHAMGAGGTNTLSATIGEQLPTGTRVLKWDSSFSAYQTAWKTAAGWSVSPSGTVSSTLLLEPGEGFFVSCADSNSVLFLCGELVMDAERGMLLGPSLSLLGYPYSTARTISLQPVSGEEGCLETSANQPGLRMELGRGYWYAGDTNVVYWSEPRPYAALTGSAKLRVKDIRVAAGGGQVELSIASTGNVAVAVLYKDVAANEEVALLANWHLAGVANAGPAGLQWSDEAGAVGRRSFNEGYARYYLAVAGMSAAEYAAAAGAQSIRLERAADGDAMELRFEAATVTPATGYKGKVIYVDKVRGDDRLSGQSLTVKDAHGPKKSMKAGCRAAERGDVIRVYGGKYAEGDLALPDGVDMQLMGDVTLTE